MDFFDGIALHDSLPKGRKSGRIEISSDQISFWDGDNRLKYFPVQNAEISHGGSGNNYIYLNHPDHKGWTFYTDDKQLLKHEAFKYNKDHVQSVRKIKNKRRLFWLSVQALLGVCVAIVLLFYIFRGQIVESVAHQIPVSWEQQLSSSLLESATAGKKTVKDKKILSDLSLITTPLTQKVEDKDFKFSFTIVEDETLNAYALPGGAIVIHSGLILKANHVNEVAGVLAHEISHVTRRHHVRGMVDKFGFFVLIRALLGDATIAQDLILAGATLEALKYSRDYELEADESGWNLMLKANLDPRGMIDFFKILDHEHGDIPEVADFMSTHPATSERIDILEHKPLEHHQFDTIPINFQDFQNSVKLYFEVN